MADIADQLVDMQTGLIGDHVPMRSKPKSEMSDEQLVEHCLYYSEKRRRKRERIRREFERNKHPGL